MNYKLKIKVTKDILEKSKMCGVKLDDKIGTNCALAMAVREIFPNCWVEKHIIRLYDGELEFSKYGKFNVIENKYIGQIQLPERATNFINLFDSMKSNWIDRPYLPEFEFEVELTEEVLQLININEVKEVLKESKTLELIEL
jgi:hypothetical protein